MGDEGGMIPRARKATREGGLSDRHNFNCCRLSTAYAPAVEPWELNSAQSPLPPSITPAISFRNLAAAAAVMP